MDLHSTALRGFAAAFALQAGYLVLLHRGFGRARRADRRAAANPTVELPPLSVVVAARDEAHNLPALLSALTAQTHACFEVVVVDDASADGTARVVQAWAEHHANVRLVRVEQPRAPRKKHALTRGIAAARYEHLVFTDADCTPPPGWLEALARRHAARPPDALLIGYSPYRRRPGLLNRLVRYETLVTAFLTAAAAGLGRPYMAVGRNLSYGRALFEAVGGFGHSARSTSGDDDLFVQAAARRGAHAHYVFDARTFVPTEAPATWRAWLRQKQRHTSAGRFYRPSVKVHLALFHASGLALWLAPLVAGRRGALLLGARLALQGGVLARAARALGAHDLLPALPGLEALYGLYTLCVAPLGLLRMPRRW